MARIVRAPAPSPARKTVGRTGSGAPLPGSKLHKRRLLWHRKGRCTRPYKTKPSEKCNRLGTGSGERYVGFCAVPRWHERKGKFSNPCKPAPRVAKKLKF